MSTLLRTNVAVVCESGLRWSLVLKAEIREEAQEGKWWELRF